MKTLYNKINKINLIPKRSNSTIKSKFIMNNSFVDYTLSTIEKNHIKIKDEDQLKIMIEEHENLKIRYEDVIKKIYDYDKSIASYEQIIKESNELVIKVGNTYNELKNINVDEPNVNDTTVTVENELVAKVDNTYRKLENTNVDESNNDMINEYIKNNEYNKILNCDHFDFEKIHLKFLDLDADDITKIKIVQHIIDHFDKNTIHNKIRNSYYELYSNKNTIRDKSCGSNLIHYLCNKPLYNDITMDFIQKYGFVVINHKSKYEETILHIMCEKNTELFEKFTRKHGFTSGFGESTNIMGYTAFHYLCDSKKDNRNCINLYLEWCEKAIDIKTIRQKYSPLHLAIINDNIPNIKKLIEKGADINCLDSFGRSPIHRAIDKPIIIELLNQSGKTLNQSGKIINNETDRFLIFMGGLTFVGCVLAF